MTPDSIDEIMRRVHRLEIKARRLARETFSGEYQSSFKGSGLDFEDYREYQHGDETRFIDWNVTARKDTPYIRTFREERELAVILAVDVSGSTLFGSKHLSKRELAAELAADAVRRRGRVVLVGVVGLDLPRDPFYMKEVEFTVSCSYGPGRYDADYERRGHDYPPGYVRWTEQRNHFAGVGVQ